MRRVGFAEDNHYQLATGAGSNWITAVDGSTLRFSPGTVIRHIEITPSPAGAVGGPAGPVFVGIEFISRGRVSHLAQGFASGPTLETTPRNVTWDGELLVDSLDSFIHAAAANDTGATVEILLVVYGDREVPEVEK